jgi:hypothetical protein
VPLTVAEALSKTGFGALKVLLSTRTSFRFFVAMLGLFEVVESLAGERKVSVLITST